MENKTSKNDNEAYLLRAKATIFFCLYRITKENISKSILEMKIINRSKSVLEANHTSRQLPNLEMLWSSALLRLHQGYRCHRRYQLDQRRRRCHCGHPSLDERRVREWEKIGKVVRERWLYHIITFLTTSVGPYFNKINYLTFWLE